MNKKYIHSGSDLVNLDLSIILIWVTVTFIIILLGLETNIRPILGVVTILFIPGYALIAAFFPKKYDLENIERIVLSLGSSIMVVSLIGISMNLTFGIDLIPIAASIWSFTTLFICITAYRRKKISEEEMFSLSLNKIYDNIVQYAKPKDRASAILVGILVANIIIAAGMIYYVVAIPKIGEKFTEFYVLNESGKIDYLKNLKLNNTYELFIGVSNHEYSTVNYTIQMVLDKDNLASKEITLNHGQSWEETMTFSLPKEGENMKFELLLFKENDFTEPYRKLHLWVDSTK